MLLYVLVESIPLLSIFPMTNDRLVHIETYNTSNFMRLASLSIILMTDPHSPSLHKYYLTIDWALIITPSLEYHSCARRWVICYN